jgi:glycosyltransferase involved in cell wall biosynthesis
MPHLVHEAPNNFNFAGYVDDHELQAFYARSRVIVIPTLCYEGFPSVCVEAMMLGKAVVISKIGGMPEIVEDGVTGLLFEPGNVSDLAEKLCYLWSRPELCVKLGQAGREKAEREYSPEKYYECLMDIYRKAIQLAPVRHGQG